MKFKKLQNIIAPSIAALQHSLLTLGNDDTNNDGGSAPQVVIDMRRSADLRSLRQLIILFQLSGYQVFVRARFNKLTLSLAKELRWHTDVKFIWRAVAAPILCTDAAAHASQGTCKTVRLRYDYNARLRLDATNFAMPFTMHPQLYCQFGVHEKLSEYRQLPRKVRMLFAGNCREGYANPIISETFGKLPRLPIVEFLKQQKLVRLVETADELAAIYAGDYCDDFLFVDTSLFRIRQRQWLEWISQTDFFLCPPGVIMPLCHNMIEAMAVGTIPVTNYADWFYPNLKHAENCLSFGTLDKLCEILTMLHGMNNAQVDKLRTQVIAYYDEHLSLSVVGKRLLNAPAREINLHIIDRNIETLRRSMLEYATDFRQPAPSSR